jgi:hypothetical protein
MAILGFISKIFRKKCFGTFEKERGDCNDCNSVKKCKEATVKEKVDEVKREWGI